MLLSLQTQTKMALGGEVLVGIVFEGKPDQELFAKIWRQIFKFEKQFSRFLPDSELSQFNRNAGSKINISKEFADILNCAKDLSIKTNGLYNPFILPALQKAGYLKSAVEVYQDDPVDNHSNKKVVTADKLEIWKDKALIPYGTAIDLGGCGKGYMADQIGDFIKSHKTIHGFWVSLSGDIKTWGRDEEDRPISIQIQNADPEKSSQDFQIICPEEGIGIATSGTFKRLTQTKGKDSLKKHHIIDPRTAKPAETDILLATICHKKAVEADVLASCTIILGAKKSDDFLQEMGVSASMIQYHSNNQFKVKRSGDMIKILELANA